MRPILRTLPPAGAPIALRAVVASAIPGWKSDGQQCDRTGRLRTSLAGSLVRRTGFTNWVGVSSGRAALTVSLMALSRLRPGCHEVVLPAYTSYSVAAAVVRAGMRLRLCDIEPETLGLSPKRLEQLVTPETLAVVSNHLYGIPCRQRQIADVAARHAVPVIEDAAQAMGFHYLRRPEWSPSQAVIFSLSRGKALPAAGGGLIGTNWPELAAESSTVLETVDSHTGRLEAVLEAALMSVFLRPSLYWLPASLPFLKLGRSLYDPTFRIASLNPFQERLAWRLITTLPDLQRIRRHNAQRFRESIATLPNASQFWVIWPQPGHDDMADFLRLPVLARNRLSRDKLLTELSRLRVGASTGYPKPLSQLPELHRYLVGAADCPTARDIAGQLFTLPTHVWVTDRVREDIMGVLAQCTL